MDRREFLLSAGAAGAMGAMGAMSLTGCDRARPPLPPGELLGASPGFGHRLRDGDIPPAASAQTQRHAVVIIGGGIAGLSAAWRLKKAGVDDFVLCELESSVGGNSRWGENAVTAYPLAAHYLPLPTREARYVRELLADLGVLHGDPHAQTPRYDEQYLCHAPQERLFRNGMWQESIMPQAGLTPAERAQLQRFSETMAEYKGLRGRDGRKAFALPLDLSSRDPALLALDRTSMRDWMMKQGFDSQPLHWYVNYACRDDYGTTSADTSAWAGIHYFACRDGEALDAASDIMLTAPEGNGWIVRRLEQQLQRHLLTDAMCLRIGSGKRRATAEVFLRNENRMLRFDAAQLIWAAPAFLLPYVWQDAPPALADAARSVSYAPWLVANLALDRLPQERLGAPLSWENVLYDSHGLGYVCATHQKIRTRPGPTVLTYYHVLSDLAPQMGRAELLAATRESWAETILAELERPHPGLREITTRLDVCRYGHAMARPTPGTMWHGQRQTLTRPYGRIQLAHADQSGLSLFEEANYRGVIAAERAMRTLGV